MGTTFVDIGGHGFWMRDGILELWLRLLALHLEDPTLPGTVATTIRDQWLLASRGYFNGCIPVGLADAVSTSEGNALVRNAIHSLLTALQTAPPYLDKGVLNIMGFNDGEFTDDFESRRLIAVGQAFLSLLDGTITTGPDDTSFMPGSR